MDTEIAMNNSDSPFASSLLSGLLGAFLAHAGARACFMWFFTFGGYHGVILFLQFFIFSPLILGLTAGILEIVVLNKASRKKKAFWLGFLSMSITIPCSYILFAFFQQDNIGLASVNFKLLEIILGIFVQVFLMFLYLGNPQVKHLPKP